MQQTLFYTVLSRAYHRNARASRDGLSNHLQIECEQKRAIREREREGRERERQERAGERERERDHGKHA